MPLQQPNRYISLFFYFYIALLIIQGCHILIGLFTADPALINEFYQFGISDWLINYESGFVRRGLVGQLLLTLYNTCPFDIGIAIIATTYISVILLSAVVIYMFYKHKTSMFILPTAFALGGFFLIKATFYRRDALMLLAIFLTLYLHRQYFGYSFPPHTRGCILLLCSISFHSLLHDSSRCYRYAHRQIGHLHITLYRHIYPIVHMQRQHRDGQHYMALLERLFLRKIWHTVAHGSRHRSFELGYNRDFQAPFYHQLWRCNRMEYTIYEFSRYTISTSHCMDSNLYCHILLMCQQQQNKAS